MTNAKIDQNFASSKLAVLNTDTVQGTHLVPIAIDGSSFAIKTDQVSTISFTMVPIDPRDENYKSVWAFVGTDNQLYPAVATADGALLVDLI